MEIGDFLAYKRISETEEELKICERMLKEQELKFRIVDSIEKSQNKEKCLLEARLHEGDLLNKSLSEQVKNLNEEVSIKTQMISGMMINTQSLTAKHQQEKDKLLAESGHLKRCLEISKAAQEEYKKTTQNLSEKIREICDKDKIIEHSFFSAEFYEDSIKEKDSLIEDLQNQAIRLKEKIKELEEHHCLYDKETKKIFNKFLKADNQKKSLIFKVLGGEDIIKESNENLKIFLDEYEKTLPIITKQKIEYQNLIQDHEMMNLEFTKILSENQEIKAKNEDLEKNQQTLNDLKLQIEYLSTQLAYFLNNSAHDNLSAIKNIITENVSHGIAFSQQEALIAKLTQENERLKSRPLVVEEVVPTPDYQKLVFLEASYQKASEELQLLRKQLASFQISNQELNTRLEILSESEKRLKEEVTRSQKERDCLLQNIANKKTINFENVSFSNTFAEVKQSQEIYLNQYKAEILRLKKENSSLFESLKSKKEIIIKHENTSKQKLEEILNEKSDLYIECKRLRVSILDLEKQILDNQKNHILELNKKDMELQRINTKEFAAISELYECRKNLIQVQETAETNSKELEFLKQENLILHEKLLNVSKKQENSQLKSKIEEIVKENFLLKSNNDLFQERIKELIKKDMFQEEKIFGLQKELNQAALSLPEVVYRDEEIDCEGSKVLELRMSEILRESEEKDKKILALLELIRSKDKLPEVFQKIVEIVYKVINH